MTGPARRSTLSWGALIGLTVGCLAGAVVFGFGGFLANGPFASGPRQPLLAAGAWALSAGCAAIPVVALPALGARVSRGAALAAAVLVAVAWFGVGFVLLAG